MLRCDLEDIGSASIQVAGAMRVRGIGDVRVHNGRLDGARTEERSVLILF